MRACAYVSVVRMCVSACVWNLQARGRNYIHVHVYVYAHTCARKRRFGVCVRICRREVVWSYVCACAPCACVCVICTCIIITHLGTGD